MANSRNKYVLDVLKDYDVITDDLYGSFIQRCEESDRDVLLLIEEAGIMSQEDCELILVDAMGSEYINIKELPFDANALALMPQDLALKFRVAPLFLSEGELTIAICDACDVDVADNIFRLIDVPVRSLVTNPADLDDYIDRAYAQAVEEIVEEVEVAESADEMAVVYRSMIDEAIAAKASDIHIEPFGHYALIRLRIDGELKTLHRFDPYFIPNLTNRVKVSAGLDITEKRLPQDGKISYAAGGKSIDIRVSTLPSSHGESTVMRLLDKESVSLDMKSIGLSARDQHLAKRLIQNTDGIILMTGPTGSGKTTTLYSFLSYLNTTQRKIITAEDPIEYSLKGINQVEINNKKGLTFVKVLKSMLRQAPNVILVGEIRDLETASIAIQASLTGHLVFSTLHTNDAPSAISRLVDIGCEPFMIASSLRAVMAQRLVRSVCQSCVESAELEPLEQVFIADAVQSSGLKALVVEDDPTSRKLLCKILQSKGYDVLEADSGSQALSIIREDEYRRIRIVMTDLNMPGINGADFIKIINKTRPDLPVVVISAMQEEVLNNLVELHIRAYLTKPINGQKLQGVLDKVLGARVNVKHPDLLDMDFDGKTWVKAQGCSCCTKGYKGRIGIYEIMPISRQIESLIYKNAAAYYIREVAMEEGMKSLAADGVYKAWKGMTTIEEVMRVAVIHQQEVEA